MNITITISYSEQEEGYMYDIYSGTPEDIENGIDSEDGGLCTGGIDEALEMAKMQAENIIKKMKS